jgi:vesicular inhibitory amino acid transporter
LFADSLHLLFPDFITVTEWKIVAFFILTPLSFVPLRILSFSSVIGILSTIGIFISIFANGLIKPESPGSLRDPMPTYIMPQSWLALPLSFGLLMSPWGGHGVFPNIFRDMRHPAKYPKAVDITYIVTYVLDAGMAVIGLLMFGDGVLDEITLNVLGTEGYPEILKVFMVIFIAIIPLTKTPLK